MPYTWKSITLPQKIHQLLFLFRLSPLLHIRIPWWRHQMETYSLLLWRKPPVSGEFPSQRLVTRSFDVFFDLRLNKRLSKQSRRPWFDTQSRSLWRRCNVRYKYNKYSIKKSLGISNYVDIIWPPWRLRSTCSGIQQIQYWSSVVPFYVDSHHKGQWCGKRFHVMMSVTVLR